MVESKSVSCGMYVALFVCEVLLIQQHVHDPPLPSSFPSSTFMYYTPGAVVVVITAEGFRLMGMGLGGGGRGPRDFIALYLSAPLLVALRFTSTRTFSAFLPLSSSSVSYSCCWHLGNGWIRWANGLPGCAGF